MAVGEHLGVDQSKLDQIVGPGVSVQNIVNTPVEQLEARASPEEQAPPEQPPPRTWGDAVEQQWQHQGGLTKTRQVGIAVPAGALDPRTGLCNDVLGPPESVEPAAIYKLYRGATGEVRGQSSRVWVDFPALQLCWAGYDLPASQYDRVSLLDITSCRCRDGADTPAASGSLRVDIYSQAPAPDVGCGGHHGESAAVPVGMEQPSSPALTIAGDGNGALCDFAEALVQLLASRDSEGRRGLEFIQKRLFQYLWRHQGTSFSEEALYEAQAVLAFNLEPREGVAYLRGKLGKGTDVEVGEWLAQMSTLKGGLDPTMLGAYFSRRDTLEVFKVFVRCLDFRGSDIVAALRLLFDTFKPGGEGQVITRILEMFAEAYFIQWATQQDSAQPRTSYKNSDSVLQVAVSLIMLNTGVHVVPQKNPGKKIVGALMTVEEYIDNTRRVVGEEEVPEEALRSYYEAVKQSEISVEPLPRAAFAKLPVQPDIEGWLVAVLSGQVQRRYWAVLALQRLYLFADASVEPADAMDLKDASVRAVVDSKACKDRFAADLQSGGGRCMCFARNGRADLVDAEIRAFEVTLRATNRPALLQRLSKPRSRLALVAESSDLMEKWVSLISSGPY